MIVTVAVFAFAAGFAGCWFAKDKLILVVTGAETFAAKLEARAAALRAAL